MRTLALIRWELVQAARAAAPHVALTLAGLASTGLVAGGVFLLDLWSPFPATVNTVTTVVRTSSSTAPALSSVIGEHRGGVAYFVLLVWFTIIAVIVGPALTAGALVRDRQSGRLDRLLADASRSDAVVLAKLCAGLVPLLLVLAGGSPSLSFAWLVGGLASQEAVAGGLVLLATIVLIVAVALVCSAAATTEVAALVSSYLVLGTILVGPLVGGAALVLAGLRAPASALLAVDPLVALLSAQSRLASGLAGTVLADLLSPRQALAIGKTTAPMWAADVLLYLVVASVLVWLASVIVEPLHPVKTWRLRRSDGEGR
ncbi:MAG: hypothetical protein IRY83_12630 [Chloroflexi bacterium]|nr:hypothetical protein [Chloroflexota bacterium]